MFGPSCTVTSSSSPKSKISTEGMLTPDNQDPCGHTGSRLPRALQIIQFETCLMSQVQVLAAHVLDTETCPPSSIPALVMRI
jgi:hypothetical protein